MNKPKLIYEPVVRNMVDYHDLEDLIKEVFGIPYETIPNMEWNNHSHQNITAHHEHSNWQKRKLKEFLEGKDPQFALQAIFDELCIRGHIDEGDYEIYVNW